MENLRIGVRSGSGLITYPNFTLFNVRNMLIAGTAILFLGPPVLVWYMNRKFVANKLAVDAKDFPREDMTIPDFKNTCSARGGKVEELGQGRYACVMKDSIAHMDTNGKVSISSK